MADFTVVTGNAKKLKEISEILGADGLKSHKLDLPEMQGTSEEIIIAKAKQAAKGLVGFNLFLQNRTFASPLYV
jgi:inosine triphosphate pyrophosphatase